MLAGPWMHRAANKAAFKIFAGEDLAVFCGGGVLNNDSSGQRTVFSASTHVKLHTPGTWERKVIGL